jgi:hypothetical protein
MYITNNIITNNIEGLTNNIEATKPTIRRYITRAWWRCHMDSSDRFWRVPAPGPGDSCSGGGLLDDVSAKRKKKWGSSYCTTHPLNT